MSASAVRRVYLGAYARTDNEEDREGGHHARKDQPLNAPVGVVKYLGLAFPEEYLTRTSERSSSVNT